MLPDAKKIFPNYLLENLIYEVCGTWFQKAMQVNADAILYNCKLAIGF